MDSSDAHTIRDRLSGTDWTAHTRDFGRALRSAGHDAGGLLLLGVPDEEPWHLAAHLDMESRLCRVPALAPVWVRHRVPSGAPAHLSIGLERLAAARRGETLFVVSPSASPEEMLERVHDARTRGAMVLAIEAGDAELRDIAHEALTVSDEAPPGTRALASRALAARMGMTEESAATAALDIAQHLVTVAAVAAPQRGRRFSLRSLLR